MLPCLCLAFFLLSTLIFNNIVNICCIMVVSEGLCGVKCFIDDEVFICDNLRVAGNSLSRLRGLLGKRALLPGEGLLIIPCNQIHTYFMRFSIDCVFLAENGEILHLIEALAPWKVSKRISLACQVLELPAGTIRSHKIAIGNYIMFKE